MNKTYFAYIRVSTLKQGEGASLEAQADAIKGYAAQNGLVISQWFEEKETAAKQGRPQFSEMIKLLKTRKADGVVMHKIDRSARNLRDWATVNELQDGGIDVHFAAESVDFSSRGGRLTADIQAVIAADYIRNLREETIKGMTGRLKQGIYPLKAPIGYLDNGGGRLKTICPNKGSIVKKLFELYATGEFSHESLRQEAQRMGLTQANGQRLSRTCIEKMLKNPFYTGIIHIKKRNETYQGKHEPLISVKLFEAVQDVRERRVVKKLKFRDYAYRRMFECVHCHTAYIPEHQKGHIYYRCHTKGCTSSTIREDLIDAQIDTALTKMAFNADEITMLTDHFANWQDKLPKCDNQTTILARKRALEDKQEHLIDAYLEKLINKETFEKHKAQFLLQEREIYNQEQKRVDQQDLREEMVKFLELTKSLNSLYFSALPAEKRQLLKILFSNCAISRKTVELEPKNAVEIVQISLSDLYSTLVSQPPRRNETLGFQASDAIIEWFSSQEWKVFQGIISDINERIKPKNLTKNEKPTDYSEAA